LSDDFRPDIWRLQAQFDTHGLEDALHSDDPGIRRRAAAALRALGAVDTIPALQAALEQESDPGARSNILAALAILQQELERQQQASGELVSPQEPLSRHDRLVRQLRYGGPDEAIYAAHILGENEALQAVVPLVMVFNDPSTPIKVRLAVAEALLKLESAPVEVALLGALRSEEPRIRRNAAAILGQLRAEWAIDPLAELLDDAVELISKTAQAALRFIGTPEAFEALRRHSERETERERSREQDNLRASIDESTAAFNSDIRNAMAQVDSPTQPIHKVPAHLMASDEDDSGSEDEIGVEGDKANQTMADGQIAWPRRERKEEANPSLAPTRPLDPKILETLEERLKQRRDQSADDETPSEDGES
jgi:HEAT repeat protein